MRARRPETMGTLYWQLDDCWPVASWSSIDYFGHWKALQYFAARFYAPLLIAAQPQGNSIAVHIVSDELQPRQASLHLRLMHFDGTVLDEQRVPAEVAALASTPIDTLTLKSFDAKTSLAVLTLEQNGRVLASNTVYFAAPKELVLPQAQITRSIRPDANGFIVELRSPVFARAVALSFNGLDAKPEDNFFDLLPNESRRIHISSRSSLAQIQSSLQVRSLADSTQ